MAKDKETTIRLKDITKKKFDKLIMREGKIIVKKDIQKFINSVVKNKGKPISHNEGLSFLLDFYLESLRKYERLSLDEKKKHKVFNKVGRMADLVT